jgi:ADP-ribose pyrophosphatase YjhB (NUDIX family)
MNGRLQVVPAVFTAIIKGNKVLLLRRRNTGWMDGYYDLPAGHLEDQEPLKKGAARELHEETGLIVDPKDLKLIHVHQNHHNPKAPHYGYIFLAKKWKGNPKIIEPGKCDDIQFVSINNLPDKMTPYVKEALIQLGSSEVTFSYHSPGSIVMN